MVVILILWAVAHHFATFAFDTGRVGNVPQARGWEESLPGLFKGGK